MIFLGRRFLEHLCQIINAELNLDFRVSFPHPDFQGLDHFHIFNFDVPVYHSLTVNHQDIETVDKRGRGEGTGPLPLNLGDKLFIELHPFRVSFSTPFDYHIQETLFHFPTSQITAVSSIHSPQFTSG